MTKVLITGGNGYVARNLIKVLLLRSDDYRISATLRTVSSVPSVKESGVSYFTGKELAENTDWSDALLGVDVLVHAASRVHITQEKQGVDSLNEFRRINVLGTEKLLQDAVVAKVKKIIFISTVGVNGGGTEGKAFTEQDIPSPHNFYSQSKLEAERLIQNTCTAHNIDYVIFRPPLTYGAYAPGNFQRLLEIMKKGFPLILGMVKNERSVISLQNLIAIILKAIDYDKEINDIFLLADPKPISTHHMMIAIAEGMNKSPLRFPIPQKILFWGAMLLKQEKLYYQLCASLRVDATKASTFFQFNPQMTTYSALRNAAKEFMYD